jgi:hypothetical protein
MTRFQYLYLRSLPGAIWAFLSMAPLRKLPIILSSIDRMANNSAVLKEILEVEDVVERNVRMRDMRRLADELLDSSRGGPRCT